MTDSRFERYRKLVRWYPTAWRERNEDAIISVMMDHDDAIGRSTPAAQDRLALLLRGLHERIIAPQRLNNYNLVVLFGGALFSLYYLGIGTWAPGVTYAGSLGPFTNPTVIVGAMLIFSLALALFSRGRTARFVALASVPVMVLIGVLSPIYSWLGPHYPTAAIFAGLGIIAASPLRDLRDAIRVGTSLPLVVVGLVAIDFSFVNGPPIVLRLVFGWVGVVVGTIGLLWVPARTLRRMPQRH